MVTSKQLMTAEELLNMPDDGYRYELVRGELRKMSPAGHVHGRYAWSIAFSMGGIVETNRLGEIYIADTGFVLAADTEHVRVPDAAFVRRERAEAVGDAPGFFPGPPDIAVEVISPSDRYTDVDEKVADLLDAGTLAVILVDPRRRVVKVHRSATDVVVLGEEDMLSVDDVVPGWRMRVEEIFG